MTDLIGGTPADDTDALLVKDATIETFQADVMEASMSVPVIVDFWATWCGPCGTLGPILEKQVKARGGKVRMVKIDTDKNQMLAQQLRIQSLPTVMAFVNGQPVDGFAGALPESQVSQFIDNIIASAEQMGLSAPTGQDPKVILEAAQQALHADDLQAAMQGFAAVTELAPPESDELANAYAGMAHCALKTGNADQAKEIMGMISAEKQNLPAVSQVNALLSLAGEPAADAPAPSGDAPTDPEGCHALGESLLAANEMEGAMKAFLDGIEMDKDWNEGASREKLLTVFEALGGADPAVKAGRRRLSSILFA